MKKILFYTDANGDCEILNYLKILELKNDKDSVLNAKKIYAYIENLSRFTVTIGEPFVKYLGNKIWELRPLRHRILFFEYGEYYVLLSHFIKDTNKTPKNEIIKVRKRMDDYLRREKANEESK